MNPRLLALPVAGLLLSACGAFTPGAAATVDDQTISMKSLDRLARVYCEVTAVSAQQQGVQAVDNAEIRRQAVTDLVLTRIARDYAKDKDLKIPAASEVDPAQLEAAFGGRAPVVARAIGRSQDLFRLTAVVGGYDTATPVTEQTTEQLAERGRAVLLGQFAERDVEFAPRLGLTDAGEASNSIGSLSVASVDFEAPAPEELPAGLSCRA